MNKLTIFLLAVLFTNGASFAQIKEESTKSKGDNPDTWKKTVLRSVYIYDTTRDNGWHLENWVNIPDTTLAGALTSMVFTRQLHPYILEGDQLKDTLSFEKLSQYMRFNNFSFYLVDKYRLLEEWTYDPANLTTKIKILAIAPVLAVFDNDGSYRGPVSMYWLKYTDVKDIIANYETKHHNKQLTKALLYNYAIGTEGQ